MSLLGPRHDTRCSAPTIMWCSQQPCRIESRYCHQRSRMLGCREICDLCRFLQLVHAGLGANPSCGEPSSAARENHSAQVTPSSRCSPALVDLSLSQDDLPTSLWVCFLSLSFSKSPPASCSLYPTQNSLREDLQRQPESSQCGTALKAKHSPNWTQVPDSFLCQQ